MKKIIIVLIWSLLLSNTSALNLQEYIEQIEKKYQINLNTNNENKLNSYLKFLKEKEEKIIDKIMKKNNEIEKIIWKIIINKLSEKINKVEKKLIEIYSDKEKDATNETNNLLSFYDKLLWWTNNSNNNYINYEEKNDKKWYQKIWDNFYIKFDNKKEFKSENKYICKSTKEQDLFKLKEFLKVWIKKVINQDGKWIVINRNNEAVYVTETYIEWFWIKINWFSNSLMIPVNWFACSKPLKVNPEAIDKIENFHIWVIHYYDYQKINKLLTEITQILIDIFRPWLKIHHNTYYHNKSISYSLNSWKENYKEIWKIKFRLEYDKSEDKIYYDDPFKKHFYEIIFEIVKKYNENSNFKNIYFYQFNLKWPFETPKNTNLYYSYSSETHIYLSKNNLKFRYLNLK